MLRRPRALLGALALTVLVAVGVLITTVLKLWGPWPPSNAAHAPRTYWGGFGGVIWAGCSVLLGCAALIVAARPRRKLHYGAVIVISVAMAGLGLGSGMIWSAVGVHDCARGFCRSLTIRIATAALALSAILFALWIVTLLLAAYSLLRSDDLQPAASYTTTSERVSRDTKRDASVGKSSLNPTLDVPVLPSTAGVPTSPLPPPPGLSSSPPSRTAPLRDTLSTLRSARTRREQDTQSTTASLIPYLSPWDLEQLERMQPGRGGGAGRPGRTSVDERNNDDEAPFETKNVSLGRKSAGSNKSGRSGKGRRKPIEGLW